MSAVVVVVLQFMKKKLGRGGCFRFDVCKQCNEKLCD
jgi:hypothetical protein